MRLHKYVHVLKKRNNEENNYTYKSKFGRKVLVCMYATNEMLTFFENFCTRGIIIVGPGFTEFGINTVLGTLSQKSSSGTMSLIPFRY